MFIINYNSISESCMVHIVEGSKHIHVLKLGCSNYQIFLCSTQNFHHHSLLPLFPHLFHNDCN